MDVSLLLKPTTVHIVAHSGSLFFYFFSVIFLEGECPELVTISPMEEYLDGLQFCPGMNKATKHMNVKVPGECIVSFLCVNIQE